MQQTEEQPGPPRPPGDVGTSTDLCRSEVSADKTSWHCFPAEVRLKILEVLFRDGCSLAGFATRHNFARITLTPVRLWDFGSVIRRNRALVHYVWLCLELEEYDCPDCAPPKGPDMKALKTDNTIIAASLFQLLSTLSTWEPNGSLLLDISAHSPNRLGALGPPLELHKLDDYRHGWSNGRQVSAPNMWAFRKFSQHILGEFPSETQWWKELPSVPAVTGVLLRQQTRRRWVPASLGRFFACLPRLQEIHYEPWMEYHTVAQDIMDASYVSLFRSLTGSKLKRIILFENLNQQYFQALQQSLGGNGTRVPNRQVSSAVAMASLELEYLSASFMVDAADFFDASAAAATEMPRLETMEIWSGGEGLAALFRYQSGRCGPAVITWKGTWELSLRPLELLDAAAVVKSQGDAFHHLNMSNMVLRPISLRQVRREQAIRQGTNP
ncbi:hypothetical protein B0T24DRAFT_647542 [Lasiosphaeria ovina]|uniref:DUF6546 domain-containing protein n=1 Tax=Lasiosphaeria ovina TaxID=92902 RepID=A0AAE0NEX2_9PEZI|nr:hypothetical protein B0T24DRAFT_647542 [Lasiosphaeria ovina]